MVTNSHTLEFPAPLFFKITVFTKINHWFIPLLDDAVGPCQGNALTNATSSFVLCSHILPLLQPEKSFCSSLIDSCAAYWRLAPFKFRTLLKSIPLLVLSFKTSWRHFSEKFKGAKNNNKIKAIALSTLSYQADISIDLSFIPLLIFSLSFVKLVASLINYLKKIYLYTL